MGRVIANVAIAIAMKVKLTTMIIFLLLLKRKIQSIEMLIDEKIVLPFHFFSPRCDQIFNELMKMHIHFILIFDRADFVSCLVTQVSEEVSFISDS